MLALDRRVGRLGRGEPHRAVPARAAVAADDDVGALDLAVLVEQRAQLLPGVGPGEALDDDLEARGGLGALLAGRARGARARRGPLAPGRALPLLAVFAARGADVAVLAVLADEELAAGEVGAVERGDGGGGLLDVLELDNAPALGAAWRAEEFFFFFFFWLGWVGFWRLREL